MTNIAIAEGKLCRFTRAVPGGMEGMVTQLAERCALTTEHARQWLVHVGLTAPVEMVEGDPEIDSEARSVLADGARRVADEVRNTIDFQRSQETGIEISGAVLTGPAVSVPGFVEQVGVDSGCPWTPASCARAIRVLPAGSTRAADDRRRTGGGGALAVRAVNLIPVKVRRGSPGKSGSGVYMLLGGLGALVLAVAAFVFVSNSVTSRQGRSRPPDDRRPTRRRRRRRPLKPYLDFANLRQKRVATIQALAQSRFPWERSMRQIARVIPSNVWLTHFIGTVAPGVTLEEVNGGDTSTLRNGVQAPAIQLIGCTYDHPEVSRLMARLRRMTGVTRVTLATSEKPKDAPSTSPAPSSSSMTAVRPTGFRASRSWSCSRLCRACRPVPLRAPPALRAQPRLPARAGRAPGSRSPTCSVGRCEGDRP